MNVRAMKNRVSFNKTEAKMDYCYQSSMELEHIQRQVSNTVEAVVDLEDIHGGRPTCDEERPVSVICR